MDLLFKRKQYVAPSFTSIKKVYFKLNAKVELTEEEQALVSKYDLRDAAIINKPSPGLIMQSVAVGLFAAFVGFVILRLTLGGALIVGPLIGIAAAFFYYHHYRKTIYLRDLLKGRTFRCKSVVELVETETWMQSVLSYLRQVIETAKHWDGVEKFTIEPLDSYEAKKAVRHRLDSLDVDIV